MKIRDKLSEEHPSFSFEFFPPKDAQGTDQLYQTIADLRSFAPTYVSVTYGAGGSTRRLTVDLVRRIRAETGIETMAHLTCVDASRAELAAVLDDLRDGGIENVLALRGDPPKGSVHFEPPPGGFAHAAELVEFIRARYDFCLAAACYPEKHPEAPDLETDLRHLKAKVDAGVEVLITQLFFDNECYFRFLDRTSRNKIHVPILAGIMPITNLSQVKRFTAMCGATIPGHLMERLEATDGQPREVRAIGVEHAILQCQQLLERGAPGIHFYTLNRSPATQLVLRALRGD
jgi:methylenetetrahydrofolate reductase (NADPH)